MLPHSPIMHLYADLSAPENSGMTPTLIVHARRIILSGRPATSVAVYGNRIAAVGVRRTIHRLRGRDTRVLDLPRATLMPAFIDAHTHFYSWACQDSIVNLVGVPSMAAALGRLREAARQRRAGEWLVARGFDKNHWGGRFPTAADLDAVTGAVPTQVQSRDGHMIWVNTAAMRLARITARTKAPPGGAILRDRTGRPTGILQENAMNLLPSLGAALTDAQVERALRAGIRRLHRHGITCVHSVEGIDAFRWFQRLQASGKLELRVRFAIPAEQIDHAAALGVMCGLGGDRLRICGVKAFSDGSLGSQSAWMFDAYPTRPGYRGVPVCVGKALRDLTRKAATAGLPMWIHAIGDRANHDVIDAIASARTVERTRLRHRIEHAQCVRPDDARRMGRLGIIGSMQPCHIVGDIGAAEEHWSNVLRWTYPVRTLRDAGVPLAFGSDMPVETFDPMVGLHAAVNRQDLRRQPDGGWQMHEAVGIRDALRAYTAGAAWAAGDEGCLGRVSPGLLADFALLSADPLRIPRDRLLDLRVVATVCDGKVVYQAE